MQTHYSHVVLEKYVIQPFSEENFRKSRFFVAHLTSVESFDLNE